MPLVYVMANLQDSAQAAVTDSAQRAATDSATASASTVMQTQEPAFRTPENANYMYIAYSVAAVIYGGYLLILRGRWSALRKRQAGAGSAARR